MNHLFSVLDRLRKSAHQDQMLLIPEVVQECKRYVDAYSRIEADHSDKCHQIDQLRAQLAERVARIKELEESVEYQRERRLDAEASYRQRGERIAALEAVLREARHAFKCIGAVSGGLPSDMSITAIANIDKLLCTN